MHNEDWRRYVDTTDEWIVQWTGIERRRMADPRESTLDLAVAAARAALADAGMSAPDLGELIVATDTPEMRIPDTASAVQHALGARHIPSYDVAGSGCAGFLQCVDIARSRVRTGTEAVLVIGVELLSRLVSWSDRETSILFGDAAGAAVIGGAAGEGEILAVTAGTDGSHGGLLTMPYGGTRHPLTRELVAEEAHKRVIMKGRELFRHAVHHMSEASLEVMRLAGISLDEIALVVPHQANLRIIEAVSARLCLPLSKFFVNIRDYGNTGSASIPLALCQARDEKRAAPGDIVLLTSFGAGLHWAAMLVRL